MQTTLAARYARAMAEVVREEAERESTAEELDRFAEAFRQSKPLRDFLLNPAFPFSRKRDGLAALAERSGAGKWTARLLQVLLRNGRMGLLPELARAFRRLMEEQEGRIPVEVTTALRLDETQRKSLEASLKRFTGREVRLEPKVDTEVLGGVRARIGSRVFDGTVAARLEKMRQQLLGER